MSEGKARPKRKRDLIYAMNRVVVYPARAALDERVSSSALRLLSMIGLHAYDPNGGADDFVYPSQETLAELVGITDRQVRRLINELEEYGYIERRVKFIGRRKKVTAYRIIFDAPLPGDPDFRAFNFEDSPADQEVEIEADSEVIDAGESSPDEDRTKMSTGKKCPVSNRTNEGTNRTFQGSNRTSKNVRGKKESRKDTAHASARETGQTGQPPGRAASPSSDRPKLKSRPIDPNLERVRAWALELGSAEDVEKWIDQHLEFDLKNGRAFVGTYYQIDQITARFPGLIPKIEHEFALQADLEFIKREDGWA